MNSKTQKLKKYKSTHNKQYYLSRNPLKNNTNHNVLLKQDTLKRYQCLYIYIFEMAQTINRMRTVVV